MWLPCRHITRYLRENLNPPTIKETPKLSRETCLMPVTRCMRYVLWVVWIIIVCSHGWDNMQVADGLVQLSHLHGSHKCPLIYTALGAEWGTDNARIICRINSVSPVSNLKTVIYPVKTSFYENGICHLILYMTPSVLTRNNLGIFDLRCIQIGFVWRTFCSMLYI